MPQRRCCCSSRFFSCFSCLSQENPCSPSNDAQSSAANANSNTSPTATTPNREEISVPPNDNTNVASPTQHDSQTSPSTPPHPSSSHDAVVASSSSSSSAEGASSSHILAVVKQDDPRPGHEPLSGDTYFSSTVQALDNMRESVDVDLDRLINYISELLVLITEKGRKSSQPKPSYRFWPKSESINKVKDFLSDTIDSVKDIVPADAKTIVRGLLQVMGTANLATTGLLVVSNILERFEDVSNNWDECLLLMKEMVFLAKIVNQITDRRQLGQGMHDEVKGATELILDGSIMCCSQMSSSKFFRLFSTTVNKEELVKLTQQLDVMYKHINIQMGIEIYDANQCKTEIVSRLYPNHAVGIDEAIREVIDLLEWGSEQNALAVILHGFGGMGKTTLAQAIFSKLEIKECKYSKVDLFENINSTPNILELQKNILKDLGGNEKFSKISNHLDGQLMLESTLEKVSAFIYIDNVLDVNALRDLLPHDMNKAKKARLLITARDLNVRKACPMKTAAKVYAMRAMSSTHAKDLLQKKMFDDPERILDPNQLNHIMEKCGGIPLMLNLVAGALRVAKDKPQEVREVMEQVKKLKGEDFGPNKLEPYLFAYDKLPNECKDPFLDICSFFHGWDRDIVSNIVGESELGMLENRALVSKDTNGVISVHDIILDLGRQKSEGVRFRFTSANQVKELLDNTEEKDIQAIKGIWLIENKNSLDISASKLDLMYKSLRVLALGSLTEVNGECSKIFKELIFFKAEITRLPLQVSKLKGLKYLSYTPKDLKLSEMPSSLRHVEFDGRLHAHAFQISSNDLLQLEHLRILKLRNFEKLKNLPEDMGHLLNGLQGLFLLRCTSIEKLPESISKLGSLRILRLYYCYKLIELPDLGSLNSLQELHLQLSLGLKALPNGVENLSSLKLLDLSCCESLLNLPHRLGNLTGLVKLDLHSCCKLESIPESIRELKLLQPAMDMSSCSRLKELPHGLCHLSYITHLSLAFSYRLEKLPEEFGKLASLKWLDLQCCRRLEKLPKGFGKLECLEELVLKHCSELRELCDDFHRLSSLQNLDLSGCVKLQKLSADFQGLVSLQHLYLRSCPKLEGKIWMDHLVKMNRLQLVRIKGSEQLVKRWAEIQKEGHESCSFVVTAGQDLTEDQKENIEKTLLSDFDCLLTSGRGEPFRLSNLRTGTLVFVFCDVKPNFFIGAFPWRLIEETVDEIQIQFQIIYIGPHFSKLPTQVQDKVFVGHMSVTGAYEILEKVYLTLGAHEDVDAYEAPHCFQMHTKVLGDGNGEKYLPSWKLLTDSEMEESVLSNCRRYLRLKQLAETTQESNMKLLRELFTPEEKEATDVFQKYHSKQDRTENSKPITCGVDELKGKNILLEMRPAHLCYDIRLPSLKEMYAMEKERLDIEIISIPIVEESTALDVLDVNKKVLEEVPWLILQNSATIITRAVKLFMVKQSGWEGGDAESEKCYTSIIWIIDSSGRIKTYKPSLFCKLEKWDVLFNHLESVSYQVRWGTKVGCKEIEELKKEEWKQLNNMSTLEFIFNHLESVTHQVREIMFQGKMICLYLNSGISGISEEVTSSILTSMMDVRDSIHIIYIPGRLTQFSLTDTIKKEWYDPLGKTAGMEGMSLLNLSGNEAVKFWMRLLHLKEEINGTDKPDKQFCEIRRFLQSFPLVQQYAGNSYFGCMVFMCEDGKMVATCSNTILIQLFLSNKRGKDRAKRLMQLLIKVSMEEGRQTDHDSSVPHLTNDIQTAATAIDQETVDLNLVQEIVDLDLDRLSKYTSNLLEHEELYQLWEFNKDGKTSSRPRARHQWPTSVIFSLIRNFLTEGVNANWVKESVSRYPEEGRWKTVTKSLLKGMGEEHWAAAGFLMVADVLERFETVSANRNECLDLLEEMNTLAIYLKQFSERPGSWTGMKREAIGSIVIGSIMCCAQIDPPKFAMFIQETIDEEALSSFLCELWTKSDIMAGSITDDLGSESGSLLDKMCTDPMINFVIGDLSGETESIATT